MYGNRNRPQSCWIDLASTSDDSISLASAWSTTIRRHARLQNTIMMIPYLVNYERLITAIHAKRNPHILYSHNTSSLCIHHADPQKAYLQTSFPRVRDRLVGVRLIDRSIDQVDALPSDCTGVGRVAVRKSRIWTKAMQCMSSITRSTNTVKYISWIILTDPHRVAYYYLLWYENWFMSHFNLMLIWWRWCGCLNIPNPCR